MASNPWILFLLLFFSYANGQIISSGDSSGGSPYSAPISVNMEKFRQELLYPHDNDDLRKTLTQSNALHDAPLLFRLPFFGFEYRYIWIHRDGYLLFNYGLLEYANPVVFPTRHINNPEREEDPSLIAPWFSRQDIPNNVPNAGVYYKLVNMAEEKNLTLKERIRLDFKDAMIGSSDFEPTYALIITWKNLTHPNRQPQSELKTNTYQVVLATDEKRTYVMFNYAWITWITDKDNFEGYKGTPPFIGFNAGNRTRSYEYEPYSQQPRVSRLTSLGFGNGLRGRFYFQVDEEIWPGCCIEREPPDMVEPDVTVLEGKDRLEAPDKMIIKWNHLKLTWNLRSPVSISLWGYRETHENYPSLTYIDSLSEDLVQNGDIQYELDLESYRTRWNWDKLDLHFGFIAINLTSPKDIQPGGLPTSPALWSSPMPLAWYFRHQWQRKHGSDYKREICEDWFLREKYSDRFAITLFRCPCTLTQAKLDRGRFAPDLQCNEIDRKCESFHKAAFHCVRSGRAAVGGAGQLCCYDDHGELIRTGDTMYGGRPARSFQFGKHPFKQRMMVPALSYWLHDVAPFFYCCKWADGEDDNESCEMYKYWRTSQDCSLYTAPGVGSVFGDPHFVTFDRVNYTFNGKGEFVLTRVNNPMHKLDVQGRFEQPPPKKHGDVLDFEQTFYQFTMRESTGTVVFKAENMKNFDKFLVRKDPPINGTRLMAVAARDNVSSIVEFRVRPEPARWQYHMYIIVDQEYVYFWDNSLRVQYFKGVTLYQPANVYNMSHIVAMFDSGAGVEVMVENGHMGVHVYLPRTYLNKTAGLLGNWSRIQDDDFVLPNGDPSSVPPITKEIHHRFGMKWRVSEIEHEDIGRSMFFHDAIPFTEFDNLSFVPEYEIPNPLPMNLIHRQNEIDNICSKSRACIFDFVVTGDREFAVATRNHENYAQKLASDIRRDVVRCPELIKPRNGRKSEIRYYIGTTVRFTCDDGYRLVGYENRKCRETGLWSWGVDAECISEKTYSLKIIGIALGIVLPLLLIGVCVCFFLIMNLISKKQHYTGERGIAPKMMEMRPNIPRNGPTEPQKKLEDDV